MPLLRATVARGVAFLVGDDALSYEAFASGTIESALDRAAREISIETRCVEEDRTLMLQQSMAELLLDGSVEGGEFLGRPIDVKYQRRDPTTTQLTWTVYDSSGVVDTWTRSVR